MFLRATLTSSPKPRSRHYSAHSGGSYEISETWGRIADDPGRESNPAAPQYEFAALPSCRPARQSRRTRPDRKTHEDTGIMQSPFPFVPVRLTGNLNEQSWTQESPQVISVKLWGRRQRFALIAAGNEQVLSGVAAEFTCSGHPCHLVLTLHSNGTSLRFLFL